MPKIRKKESIKIKYLLPIIVLALTTIGGIGFSIYSQINSSSKQIESSALLANAYANATVEDNNSNKVSTQANYYATQVSTLATQVSTLTTQVYGLYNLLGNKEITISALSSAIVCENKPSTIDYSSNSSVSESLKTWLGDTQGKIDYTTWDIVWNNSKTTIHKLTGKYLFVYVVFFNDTKMGSTNGVFDVGNMCWLDKK